MHESKFTKAVIVIEQVYQKRVLSLGNESDHTL